jgi:hypothetical protein
MCPSDTTLVVRPTDEHEQHEIWFLFQSKSSFVFCLCLELNVVTREKSQTKRCARRWPSIIIAIRLLQWNETRRVRSTDTGSTVFDRFVRDGEFSEIVTDHFGLDFDGVERFALMHTDH